MIMVGKDYEIQIEVENKCYLDCAHCSSLSMRNADISAPTNEEIIKFVKIFDVPLHIYFTGGEPLANAGIETLIRTVKAGSPKSKVGIFSCGILSDNMPITESYANILKDAGLDDCYVSLYHYNSQKHDLITNRIGSYDITIKSIQALIKAKIDVKIHLVLNSYNYQELDKIISSFLNIGVSQIRLLRLVKSGAAANNWELIGVSYQKQNEEIMRIISTINNYYGKVTISGFPADIPCRPAQNAIKCQAGTNLLYVTSSKQVYPCACTKNNESFLIGYISESDKLKKYLEDQQDQLFNDTCLNPICF